MRNNSITTTEDRLKLLVKQSSPSRSKTGDDMPSRGHYAVVISCWLAGTTTMRRRDYAIWTNGTELVSRNHLLAVKVDGVRFAFDCPHHPAIVNRLKSDRFVRGQIDRWVPCLSCCLAGHTGDHDTISLLQSIAREPLLAQDEMTAVMAVMGYTHRRP